MAYKLTNERFHALANGTIIASTLMLVYSAWVGDEGSKAIAKFALDTAPSWLTFLTAVLAAMVVFIAIVFTVQDPLFWALFSGPIDLERKAYKAILLLGTACFFLICSSQQPPSYKGWQGALAILGFVAGSQGLIKSAAVFVMFYDMNYGERRKSLVRKSMNPSAQLRARLKERRLASKRVRIRR